jgi:formyl-CoA transferase
MMGTHITHKPVKRNGNRGAGMGVYGIYKCAPGGDDDYAFIFTSNEEMWQLLCQAMGQPELIKDERFATNKLRWQHVDELSAIINAWTGQRTKHEVQKILGDASVPCGKILDTVELLADPHLRQRGMIVDLEHPVRGKFSMPGCPVQLEDSPAEIRIAPLLGQHNEEVYGQLLGLGSDQLAQLKEQGVI